VLGAFVEGVELPLLLALAGPARMPELILLTLDRRESVDLARRAVRAAGDDPVTLGIAAQALAYGGEDIEAAIALIDRSLELNPSYAGGWHISGCLRLWAGQPDLAIEHFEAGLRLSPRDRSGNPAWGSASKAESALRIFGADRGLLLVEGIAIAKLIMLAIAYPFRRGR
jgi:tetratricopeptide (TPR) repeat protein